MVFVFWGIYIHCKWSVRYTVKLLSITCICLSKMDILAHKSNRYFSKYVCYCQHHWLSVPVDKSILALQLIVNWRTFSLVQNTDHEQCPADVFPYKYNEGMISLKTCSSSCTSSLLPDTWSSSSDIHCSTAPKWSFPIPRLDSAVKSSDVSFHTTSRPRVASWFCRVRKIKAK